MTNSNKEVYAQQWTIHTNIGVGGKIVQKRKKESQIRVSGAQVVFRATFGCDECTIDTYLSFKLRKPSVWSVCFLLRFLSSSL